MEVTNNWMQTLNEALISAYLYQLIMLSDLNPLEDHKANIGWLLMSTILLNTLASVIKAGYDVYQTRKRRKFLATIKEKYHPKPNENVQATQGDISMLEE